MPSEKKIGDRFKAKDGHLVRRAIRVLYNAIRTFGEGVLLAVFKDSLCFD